MKKTESRPLAFDTVRCMVCGHEAAAYLQVVENENLLLNVCVCRKCAGLAADTIGEKILQPKGRRCKHAL
ncbi:MAG: hypothetical protein OCU18_03765 [Candidatus Syntrophoarchaeum sp.]|nr:hypothetical protein [Candidatus Syntrophoarchaeum sp.]